MKDPVCGMLVDPRTAKGGHHEHGGTTYYFCNPKCRDRFIAEPARSGATPRPGFAAAASLSSVSVIGNAFRLRTAKL